MRDRRDIRFSIRMFLMVYNAVKIRIDVFVTLELCLPLGGGGPLPQSPEQTTGSRENGVLILKERK